MLSSYSLFPLVATAMSLALMPIVWRRRPAPGLAAYLAMLACSAIWSGLQALQVMAPNEAASLLAAKLQMVGIAGSPVFLLLFVHSYCNGTHRPLWNRTTAGLLFMPAVTMALTFSNEWHGLVWSQTRYEAGLPLLAEWGPAFFLHSAYCHALALVALGGGIWHMIEQPFRSLRTLSILGGPIFVLAVNAVHLSGFSPFPIDPTPTAFTLGLFVCGVSLFRFQLFEVSPIARARVLQEMGDAVVALDASGHIVDLNPAARSLVAAEKGDAFGARASGVLPAAIASFVDSGEARGEVEVEAEAQVGRASAVYDVAIAAIGEAAEQGNGRLVVLRDVTDRRRAEDELHRTRAALEEANRHLTRLAATDELTGLASRRCFMDRIESEFARADRHGSRVGLLVIDIDHFKAVNDRYGHAAGDEALCVVGDCISRELRASDLAGRIGGEEFAVIVCEADLAGCGRFAEKIRERVSALSLQIDGDDVSLSVSIGCAVWRDADDAAKDLLARADAAMYEAKAAGRNRVACAPG